MRYYSSIIKSFSSKDTEAMYHGTRVARFVNIEAVAMRKLAMLNRAACIDDLRVPPGNRLEMLKGDRKGQWSIRSEEHTSELQSIMRISYAVFCLKKQINIQKYIAHSRNDITR